MSYDSDLRRIAHRLGRQITVKEAAIQTLMQEILRTQQTIEGHENMVSALQEHLASFVLNGLTCLDGVLEFKARQSTVKRKLATVQMQLEERREHAEKLQKQMAEEGRLKQALQKRQDKMTIRIKDIRKSRMLRLLNQNDNETEELLNWRT